MAKKAASEFKDSEENDRKRAIDGQATLGAEEVFQDSLEHIVVAAGEGAGDRMPGAHVGQQLGSEESKRETLYGIFDYVDGTTLAARGLDGAVSLGAIGRKVTSVPDLQVYCLLLPPYARDLDIDLFRGAPEHVGVEDILALYSRWKDWKVGHEGFRVLTHSVDTGTFHDDLIRALRGVGGVEVIIPHPVIIEPNYLLSIAGFGKESIDAMIGVFGFPEMVFACALFDLFKESGWRMVMRPAGLEAKSSGVRSRSLMPLLDFTDYEKLQLSAVGLLPDRQYERTDFVSTGSALAAAVFAVTDNPLLQLGAAVLRDGVWSVEGIMLTRASHVRVIIRMRG